MYTIDILNKGIEYLGITDKKVIEQLINDQLDNIEFHKELDKREAEILAYKNRFVIPTNITKTAIKQKIKETNQKIYALQDSIINSPSIFKEFDIEEFVAFKKKLQARLLYKHEDGLARITQAKAVPMTNYIEFDRAGFAKCPFHNEKTGSFKYYPNDNKAHCFSGCGSKDTIDVVMQLNNIDLPKALKMILQ